MRIVCIGGNHPRHLYYYNRVHSVYPLSGAILVSREDIVPIPPNGISASDRQNFVKHFNNRKVAEKRYFGNQFYPDCEVLEVPFDKLNTVKSKKFIEKIKPDVVLIFGCGLIKDPLYSSLPYNSLNLHLGLSPRYRGAATLFWPFYFMEPNFAGSTIHYIVGEPDAGDIVHQVVPQLDPRDKIHDVACKTVIASADDMVKLLKILEKKGKLTRMKQRGTGKNFLGRDFRPEHLRVIYDVFKDDMVRQFLQGKITKKEPKLIRQF